MSVRSLNWLKFGGLVGLAFVLGLLFAGLLDLPASSEAQTPAQLIAADPQLPARAPSRPAPEALRPLVDLSDAFATVAEMAKPSVVVVRSQRTERATARIRPQQDPFFGFPLPDPRGGGGGGPRIERGSGSGFLVSGDGYIMTNNHVVDGADKVEVQLLDRRTFQAKVVGTDPHTDVAVLKIEARGLHPMTLGSSATTRVGEWVLAIGNPLGDQLTFTVTAGIVSAKGRGQLQLQGYNSRNIQDFIQTDAAINPGNSGGPLVNVRGEVIGINSAIASQTGYSMGYGFAIPIDLARQVMRQLIAHGRVERAALGVFVVDADGLDARDVGLPEIRGVEVQSFSQEDSPAKAAGLALGDIIVAVDGQPVQYTAQLQQVVGFKRPGEAVKVEVARKGGVRRTYTVRLIAADATAPPPQRAAAAEDSGNAPTASNRDGVAIRGLGFGVTALTPQLARDFRIPATVRGLLVQDVDPEGQAAQYLADAASGLPDVIVGVDGKPVQGEADLRNAVRAAGPNGIVMLTVFSLRAAQDGQPGLRVVRLQVGR